MEAQAHVEVALLLVEEIFNSRKEKENTSHLQLPAAVSSQTNEIILETVQVQVEAEEGLATEGEDAMEKLQEMTILLAVSLTMATQALAVKNHNRSFQIPVLQLE